MQFVYVMIRVCFAVLFIYSSISKFSDQNTFSLIVRNYQILPELWVSPFSIILPRMEIFISVMLLSGWEIGTASIIGILMLLAFSLAVSANLIRGRTNVSCGCFGKNKYSKINWEIIARNLIFVIALLFLFLTDSKINLPFIHFLKSFTNYFELFFLLGLIVLGVIFGIKILLKLSLFKFYFREEKMV